MMKKIVSTAMLALGIITATAQPPQGGRGDRAMYDKSADSILPVLVKEEIPKFQKFLYNDGPTRQAMEYHIFIPKNYTPSKQYPLLLFMGDASTVGDAMKPMTQGWGALIWTTDAEQAKHESFVVVPSYVGTTVNDGFRTSEEVEMTLRMLDEVCRKYSIDRSRLYTTGQSMGGMMSFYFNIAHPHLFAASLFVGSQWDTSKMGPFINNKFFYIVGGGDTKASAGMNQLKEQFLKQGTTPNEGTWNAKLPLEEQNAKVREMISKGAGQNFIMFTPGSVMPASNIGIEHMNSFDYAYRLEAVRDWLFKQRLDTRDLSLKGLKNAYCSNDADWHGPKNPPLHAIKKAIDKDAVMVTFGVHKNAAGTLVLYSKNDTMNVETTLHDAISISKGRIVLAINKGNIYLDDIKAEIDALDARDNVLLFGVDRKDAEGYRIGARVDLDAKTATADLRKALAEGAEVIELRYKNEKKLDAAIKTIGGRAAVMVNTTEKGFAGNRVDAQLNDDLQKVWGELYNKGVNIIRTNHTKQVRYMLTGKI